MLRKRWARARPDTVFCNPEFNAVGQTIRAAQKMQQRIILIFPGWPAQSWWQVVQAQALEMVELPEAAAVFEPIEKK
jgi:pyruvate/2-oxoglutarate dehydrogenase complex dihydrolipoamide dehydrogenase (E3) component